MSRYLYFADNIQGTLGVAALFVDYRFCRKDRAGALGEEDTFAATNRFICSLFPCFVRLRDLHVTIDSYVSHIFELVRSVGGGRARRGGGQPPTAKEDISRAQSCLQPPALTKSSCPERLHTFIGGYILTIEKVEINIIL